MGSSWDTAATHGGTSLSHGVEKWDVRKFESRVSTNLRRLGNLSVLSTK